MRKERSASPKAATARGAHLTTLLVGATLALAASGCAVEVLEEEPAGEVGVDEVEGTSQALTLQSFTDQYVNYNPWYVNCSGNGWWFPGPNGDIKGYEPEEEGTYPVFMFVMGTYAPWDAPLDEALIQHMANKGFVAATIEYNNDAYAATCNRLETKSKCIFNQSNSNSAVSKLCARSKADCAGKGVYVVGHSQGAHQASLAANFGSDYKAAYLIGNGDVSQCGSDDIDHSACLDKPNLAFASNQIRSVSGEHDECFGINQSGVQTQLQNTTGVNCSSGTYDCLQTDGSGWLIVHDEEPTDGYADHCYFSIDGCSNYNNLDSSWTDGTSLDWQMQQNLDWLASQ